MAEEFGVSHTVISLMRAALLRRGLFFRNIGFPSIEGKPLNASATVSSELVS